MTETDRAPRPTARPGRRGRGRPRGASSAATRRQVLDAATEVIGTNGYGATSMAAVAQAAGISPSGLAHYFSSREELLAAVLERRDELDHSSPEMHAAAQPGQPFACLRPMVELARANMEREQMVRVFVAVTGEATHPEHPAHPWMRHHYIDLREEVERQVREEVAAGTLREDTPVERIVAELYALMDGYQIRWLLDESFDMAQALADRIDELAERWGSDG